MKPRLGQKLGRGFVTEAVRHPLPVVVSHVFPYAGDRVRGTVEPEVSVKLVLDPAVEGLVHGLSVGVPLRDIEWEMPCFLRSSLKSREE